MPYKLNVDEITIEVTALLAEEIDVGAKKFDTYETTIVELTIESVTPKKKNKWIRKSIEGRNKDEGEGSGQPEEDKEGKGKELSIAKSKETKQKTSKKLRRKLIIAQE